MKSLLDARKRDDILNVLDRIYSSDNGASNFVWRALGDRESNFATVHLTSNPEVSLVERITNSIDATFEQLAEETPELKKIRSPREFSEKALGFKGGVIADSIKRRKKTAEMESGVVVTLWDGDSPDTPTIDVKDNGIGLTAQEIPDTILSLNKSNKITKWYLMGRFGQGGSTTFAFTEYTILITRKFNDGSEVAFTIVKFLPPAKDEKDGKYVYLVKKDDNLPLSLKVDRSIELYANTLVRHINYRMRKQNLLTLYGKLQYYLFDPVLPFRIVNQQVGAYQDRLRRIYGSRDRLNRSDFIETRDEIQVPANSDVDYGIITLRYWLFKKRIDNAQKLTFVDPEYPIVITYYGQSHSVLPRRILSECQLPYLQKDLVVQIDCDLVNDIGRRALFPSTRESVTSEGSTFIRKLIIEILSNSRELREINRHRQEEFLTEGFTKEREEMRKNLAEMINRILPGRIAIKGGNKGEGDKKPAGPHVIYEPHEEEIEEKPISMKDFPTYLKIINKADPLIFRPNQSTRIEIESDAPNGFLAKNGAHFSLSDEADKLVQIFYQRKDFQYGRTFVTTRVKDEAPLFTKFTFEICLNTTKLNSGEQVLLKDDRPAIIDEPLLKKEKPSNIQTDAPYIEVVDRNHEYYKSNNWTEKDVADVKESPDKTIIYVSVENEWYIGALRRSKYTESRQRVVQNRYVLLIAFYAYLQNDYVSKLQTDIDKQNYDKIADSQLEIAARTILTGLTSEKAFDEGSE